MAEKSDTPRFDWVTRESLDDRGKAIWDKRQNTIGNGPTGHFNVLMHTPPLCELVHDLETYFRKHSSLTEYERELMTLAIVREGEANFGWGRHEKRGRECGIPDDVIEALRARAPLERFPAKERLMVELARSLTGTKKDLPEALHRKVLAEKGERWTIEAIALAGHYTMVGVLIHGFGVVPREADGPTF
jgi:4-carboxymuconolactone decarboxylase